MGKIMMIIALIFLGLFTVLMINNNVAKPKPAAPEALLSIPSVNPSPSQTHLSPAGETLNIKTAQASSSSTSEVESETATIKTSKGDIEIAFYTKDAPNTVKNFVGKAKSGFYNNLIFHRVEDWVIQGGDPDGNGAGGGNMPTELNNKPFVVGSVGVARGGDINISNDAQFFIVKTDAQFLNGQYTNFGIVTKGMDVVNKIEVGSKILEIITK